MEKSNHTQDEMIRKAAVLSCYADKMRAVGDFISADSFAGKSKAILRKVYQARDIDFSSYRVGQSRDTIRGTI